MRYFAKFWYCLFFMVGVSSHALSQQYLSTCYLDYSTSFIKIFLKPYATSEYSIVFKGEQVTCYANVSSSIYTGSPPYPTRIVSVNKPSWVRYFVIPEGGSPSDIGNELIPGGNIFLFSGPDRETSGSWNGYIRLVINPLDPTFPKTNGLLKIYYVNALNKNGVSFNSDNFSQYYVYKITTCSLVTSTTTVNLGSVDAKIIPTGTQTSPPSYAQPILFSLAGCETTAENWPSNVSLLFSSSS